MKTITIKGWMAKDSGCGLYDFETGLFKTKPKLFPDGIYEGIHLSGLNGILRLDLSKLRMKRGECKKVKITIEEIK